MANATATENCFLDQCCDHDLDIDEFSNIDNSLVMSLLEDSQVEEDHGDEEMLRCMIQSLEPEIMNQDSFSETNCSSEEYRFSDVDDQLESCCSTSPDHNLDSEWIDMEMDYSSYLIGDFTEKIETMVEVGECLGDYSQVCYGMLMAMEEDDYNIGLWQ